MEREKQRKNGKMKGGEAFFQGRAAFLSAFSLLPHNCGEGKIKHMVTDTLQLQILLRNIQSLCIEARELRCGGVRFFLILLTAPCCILLLAYKKCAN